MELTTLQKIQKIRQKQKHNENVFNEAIKTSYYVDLSHVKDLIEELTETSFNLFENAPNVGRKQVSNTPESNRTGHIAELAVMSYFQAKNIQVTAPDIIAYANNTRTIDDKPDYDVYANNKNYQVKGISSPAHPSYQITKFHNTKYLYDGTDEVIFVLVNQTKYEAWIYGIATPSDINNDNCIETNMRSVECYSARNVARPMDCN